MLFTNELVNWIERNSSKIYKNNFRIRLLTIAFRKVIWFFTKNSINNEINSNILKHYSIYSKENFELEMGIGLNNVQNFLDEVKDNFFRNENTQPNLTGFNNLLECIPSQFTPPEMQLNPNDWKINEEGLYTELLFHLFKWEGRFFDVEGKIYAYLHIFRDYQSQNEQDVSDTKSFLVWYSKVSDKTLKKLQRSPLKVLETTIEDDPLLNSLIGASEQDNNPTLSLLNGILKKYNLVIENEITPISGCRKIYIDDHNEWELVYVVNHKINIYWDIKSSLCGTVRIPGLDKNELEFCYKGSSKNSSNVIFENIRNIVNKSTMGGYKNFFIKAPPGSGKEMYAKLIVSSVRHRYMGPFLVINASKEESEVLKILFGEQQNAAIIRGYLDKAQRGAVFMDEIGKSKETLRSRLLRFLQTGDYMRIGGTEILDRGDVLLIFASTNEDREKAKNPVDFWTRLEEIELENPLVKKIRKPLLFYSTNKISEKYIIELKDYLNYLFNQFWWDTLDNRLTKGGNTPFNFLYTELIVKKLLELDSLQECREKYKDKLKSLLKNRMKKQKTKGNKIIVYLTYRDIRRVVSEIANQALSNFLKGEPSLCGSTR